MHSDRLRPFEEVQHTADLCLRVRGRDLPEFFVNAAQGMFHLMRCRSCGGNPLVVNIALSSHDIEALLVDWLNELLYLFEDDQICPVGYHIEQLTTTHLMATVTSLGVSTSEKLIKAATYSYLDLEPTPDGYETLITFDV